MGISLTGEVTLISLTEEVTVILLTEEVTLISLTGEVTMILLTGEVTLISQLRENSNSNGNKCYNNKKKYQTIIKIKQCPMKFTCVAINKMSINCPRNMKPRVANFRRPVNTNLSKCKSPLNIVSGHDKNCEIIIINTISL